MVDTLAVSATQEKHDSGKIIRVGSGKNKPAPRCKMIVNELKEPLRLAKVFDQFPSHD